MHEKYDTPNVYPLYDTSEGGTIYGMEYSAWPIRSLVSNEMVFVTLINAIDMPKIVGRNLHSLRFTRYTKEAAIHHSSFANHHSPPFYHKSAYFSRAVIA